MVAAVPGPFARWATKHLRLHLFDLPLTTPEVEVAQSWHPRSHADPVHKWLRGVVREVVGDDQSP